MSVVLRAGAVPRQPLRVLGPQLVDPGAELLQARDLVVLERAAELLAPLLESARSLRGTAPLATLSVYSAIPGSGSRKW